MTKIKKDFWNNCNHKYGHNPLHSEKYLKDSVADGDFKTYQMSIIEFMKDLGVFKVATMYYYCDVNKSKYKQLNLRKHKIPSKGLQIRPYPRFVSFHVFTNEQEIIDLIKLINSKIDNPRHSYYYLINQQIEHVDLSQYTLKFNDNNRVIRIIKNN